MKYNRVLIGREKEMAIIESAIKDSVSHFIPVYGRRGVGKTFLIRNAGGDRSTFQHAGVSDGGFTYLTISYVTVTATERSDFKNRGTTQ